MEKVSVDPKSNELIGKIVSRAIGGAKIASVDVICANQVETIGAYWDGGNRSQYFGFDANGCYLKLPAHGGATQFGRVVATIDLEDFPFVVKVTSWQSRKTFVSVFTHPIRFGQFVSTKTFDLTEMEKYALQITKSLISRARADEWARRYPPMLWEPTRERLRNMGLLSKNNSITVDGRNQVS